MAKRKIMTLDDLKAKGQDRRKSSRLKKQATPSQQLTANVRLPDNDISGDFVPDDDDVSDEDSDVMSEEEFELAGDISELLNKKGDLIRVCNDKVVDRSRMLKEILQSEKFHQLSKFKRTRFFLNYNEMKKEAEEDQESAEQDEVDFEESMEKATWAMIRDVADPMAAARQVKITDTFMFEDGEYEVATMNVKFKVPTVLNKKVVWIEKERQGVKVFADGSIAVRKIQKKGVEHDSGQRPNERKRRKV